MDKKKAIAAQKIETPQEVVTFLIEHDKYSDLAKYEKELLGFINLLEQFPYHKHTKIQKHFGKKDGKPIRKYARREYKDRIKSLNSLKEKILRWHDRPIAGALKKFQGDIDKLISAYEESMPEPAPGKYETNEFKFLATTTKTFWLETLGNESFFYDDLKPNENSANEFADDLVMALFRGRSITDIKNLPQAFRRLSDARTQV